ncbi:MAG: GntR family transcriptional regulator [Chloroflexota bacterium]|nr:GntR family transcriptional regulator [Chloroflexota bacterium]
MTTLRVSRESALPLYEQVRLTVLANIRDRGLGPGSAIESEVELCARFDVSRTVIRQALGELERQGVIARVQGKGTFVSEPKVREHFLDTTGGLFHDLARQGRSVSSRVVSCQMQKPDPVVAQALEIENGPVVMLDRVRSIYGHPLVLTRSYLPPAIGADLIDVVSRSDLSSSSLYALLEEHYGIRIATATRMIEAVSAERWLAPWLEIRTGAPVLRLRSIARDESDRPVEYFEAWHRGDRTVFELSVGSTPLAGETTR